MMRAARWLWFFAACLWGLAGCSGEPRTKIVVAVHSDLRPGTELSRVRVQTYDAEGAKPVHDSRTFHVSEGLAQKGEVRIPFHFSVVKGRQSRFLLVLTGYGASDIGPERVVAEYKARVTFTEGEKVLLKVFLGRACAAQSCSADSACYSLGEHGAQRGQCGSIVELQDLPVVVPGKELKPIELGPAHDAGAGTDLDQSDSMAVQMVASGAAAYEDAGQTPSNRESDSEVASCEPDAGCSASTEDCAGDGCDAGQGTCGGSPEHVGVRCEGGVCNGAGECVPCLSAAECSSDAPFCVANACVACRSPADCNSGRREACIDGSCIAQPYCGDGEVGEDEECDPESAEWDEWTCSSDCRRKYAYNACDTPLGPCGDGGLCFGGICLVMCDAASQCPPLPASANRSPICEGGCRASCRSTADCPPHLVCGSGGSCMPCSPEGGVETDFLCPHGQTCRALEDQPIAGHCY